MKILRVIGSMDPSHGGPCQGIRNSIPALERLGIQNEVLSLDDPKAPFLAKDSFQIHALGPSRGPWGHSSNLIPWLDTNLNRFDIVIIHGLWQYYSYATWKAVRRFKKMSQPSKVARLPKLFVMPHGMLDPYFQRAPDRKLKAIRNWIYWKLIERKVINESDGILFTCEAELLLAREPFQPYNPKLELNVGYGIEQPPPYDQAMSEAFFMKCNNLRGQPYVLFLSRIHEKKGVDLLIKAYAKTFGKDSPKLVVAGPGLESPYGQKLIKLISENEEVNSSIFFPGMLSGDAKWGAFYGCDAFVLPSHQENFGIAVVEALACSKPVLISDQVNIWREIKAGGAGIVSSNTEKGVQEMLENWGRLNNSEKLEMGKMARSTFEELYAIGPAATRLLETLQKIMSH
ncbi:MAG: glycosyltransferase [Cyclobacteriaceae bacterium]|nr:glycosyltransferase [Cyclobacteriaceae bacterium]MDH4295919.1 glycosyltransferase [Cyclobacteriaceae bacterium]MDH5247438.1 glycosyltransferase [Cyclobacteriaceae bacterium]